MIGSANDVVDDHDRSRFVLEQAGSTAELVYRNEPGRLIRINTDVPDPFAGRGIGGRLVQAAIERAKTEGLTIVPRCPFARTWLTEHPDAVGGIDIDAAMPSNGQAPMAESCAHLQSVNENTVPSSTGCEDCTPIGGRWVHLRLCMHCGHVGCCNSSPNRHATAHCTTTRPPRHPLPRTDENCRRRDPAGAGDGRSSRRRPGGRLGHDHRVAPA
jgi:predicted GNAT family acetyltransferase